jgi:hypothetical protein
MFFIEYPISSDAENDTGRWHHTKKPPAKPVVDGIVLAELFTRSQFDLNQRLGDR